MNDNVNSVAVERSDKQVVSENLQAQEPAKPIVPSHESDTQMRVFIDPQTGEMRAPTREEVKTLGKPLTQRELRTTAEPEKVVHPDGTISIRMDKSQMKYKTIKVCEDGTLSANCQSLEKND